MPGTNFAAATWLDLIRLLAEHQTVHAVDLPGQPGLSDPARPKGARAAYGAWFTELLVELDLDSPWLIGHSLGAMVALSGAVQGAPMGRLLLVDPAGLTRLNVSPTVLRPTIPWLRSPDQRTATGLLRMMMAPGSDPSPVLVDWMALVGRHVRTSLAPSPIPRRALESLRDLPVEVLSGRHDAFLPHRRLARAVDRRLPEAAAFFATDQCPCPRHGS